MDVSRVVDNESCSLTVHNAASSERDMLLTLLHSLLSACPKIVKVNVKPWGVASVCPHVKSSAACLCCTTGIIQGASWSLGKSCSSSEQDVPSRFLIPHAQPISDMLPHCHRPAKPSNRLLSALC